MDVLKNTPLLENHLSANARMVPFAGWNMPVQYEGGIIKEHIHTRTFVSIFDICHMGEFRISGENAAEEMDRIFPRGVVGQKIGTCRYNFLLTEQGTVLDDLIIYKLDENEFFVVVNAGTKDSDATCLRSRLSGSVTFVDESDITAKIDLQGPASADVMEKLGFPKKDLPLFYHWTRIEIDSVSCLLSRTGYTGELGFEIYCPVDQAPKLWQLLLKQDPVEPAGLGARDTLRLEMGYPLYGHELDTETTPLEAGFGPLLKLDTERMFTGCEILRAGNLKKNLVGIELEGRRATREGAKILNGDQCIGHITSGAFSPSLEKAIAMGYVNSDNKQDIGDTVQLEAGRKLIPGHICEMPFYKTSSLRQKLS